MSERDVTPKAPFKFKLRPRLLGIIVVVIVVIILIMSSFYVVDQTEEAVVLQFGKFNRITGAGLHFKMPFGIEKNYNVKTQRVWDEVFGFRIEKSGVTSIVSGKDYSHESLMLTGDLNIIDVQWIIQYKIVDPKAWLFNVEYKTQTIRDISQSILNLMVGDRAILDVMGPERTNIEVQSQQMLNAMFKGYNLGVEVITVKLQNIVPPKGAVQDAFEDVNKATQDMNRLINEGKEAYNKEIPQARGEAEQIVRVAQGYAAERVNKANGDVARFEAVLKEYRKNPSIMRTRLYYEMVEDVFKSDHATDLIDRSLKNFVPFKPLESGTKGGAQ